MRGSPRRKLGGLLSLPLLAPGSRKLDARALPGDGGGIDLGVPVGSGGKLGDVCGFLSSPPPRMDDIDMPPDGRCDAKDARSRTPAKGDAVGGPRGAEPGSDDALEGRWGGEGGGICRDGKA